MQNVILLMVTGKVVLLPQVASNSVLVCICSSGVGGYELCDLYTDGAEEPKRISSMEQLSYVIGESPRICVSCCGV